MKKLKLNIALLLLALIAISLFYFHKKPYSINISQAQIQKTLEQKMPFEKSYLALLTVKLRNPSVNLIDQAQKGGGHINIGFDFDLSLMGLNLIHHNSHLTGHVLLDTQLQYSKARATIYLVEPKVIDFKWLPENQSTRHYDQHSKKALAFVAEHYFEHHPIYTIKPKNTKLWAAKKLLKDIQVSDQKIVLKFGV